VSRGRWPGVTLAVSALALIAAAAERLRPGLLDALLLDRAAVARGELWRLLTGQLVHLSLGHLACDLASFAALGLRFEASLGPRRTLLALLSSAALVDAVVLLGLAGGDIYGGISGVAVGLLVAGAAVELSARGRAPGGALAALSLGLTLALLALKLAYEIATGRYPIVDGVEAAPAVHLAGALAGLAAAWDAGPSPRRCAASEAGERASPGR
jgi:rhomboid family GlyGly-CTERM serine protease